MRARRLRLVVAQRDPGELSHEPVPGGDVRVEVERRDARFLIVSVPLSAAVSHSAVRSCGVRGMNKLDNSLNLPPGAGRNSRLRWPRVATLLHRGGPRHPSPSGR